MPAAAEPTDHVPGRRGRPRLVDDDALLGAALHAFAANGFDAMSVRSLNAELGLSHAAVSQRFGTKEELFAAAVGHGLDLLLSDIDAVQRRLLAAAAGTTARVMTEGFVAGALSMTSFRVG